jgi:branched-chain amino acid transport system substrate-binding protein
MDPLAQPENLWRKIMRELFAFFSSLLLLATPACAADQGVSKTSVRIGAFAPLSGAQSAWGIGVLAGMEVVFRGVNDKGGIHGRKIELFREDDRCAPADAVAAAKKLIYSDQVFALAGGICSNAALAAKQEIASSGTPWLIASASADELTVPPSPNIFSAMLPASVESRAMLDRAVEIGAKKIGVVAQHDAWGRARYVPLMADFEKRGIKPVADEEIGVDQTDASAIALRLKNAGAEAVILVAYPGPAATYLRDAYKLAFTPLTLGGSTLDMALFRDTVGIPEAVAKLQAIAPVAYAADDPKMTDWRNRVAQVFPDQTFTIWHLLGVVSAQVVVDSLERAGAELTTDAFVRALGATNLAPDPYGGPVKCSVEDHQCYKTVAWFGYGTKVERLAVRTPAE